MASFNTSQFPILLVDTPENTQTLLKELGSHFMLIPVHSESDAIAELDKTYVAIVLVTSDVNDLNGPRLFESVRNRHPEMVRLYLNNFSNFQTALHGIEQGLAYLAIDRNAAVYEKTMALHRAIEHYYFNTQKTRIEQQIQHFEKLQGFQKLTVFLTDFVSDKINPVFSFISTFDSKMQKLAREYPGIETIMQSDKYFNEFKQVAIDQLTTLSETLRRIGNDINYVLLSKKTLGSVNIQKLILSIAESKTKQQRREITIDVTCDENAETVVLPVGQFEYIFSELLDNAIRYLPKDNGRISVEVYKAKPENADALIIRIRDNGCGIPTVLQSKIFDEPTTSHTNRAGLGLFSVAHIIHEFGGTITFESIPEKGTTFVIQFPIQPEQ